jgi:hypothetical protein
MALKLPGILGKIISILGKIADVAIKGRQAGLWDRQAGPSIKPLIAHLPLKDVPPVGRFEFSYPGALTAKVAIGEAPRYSALVSVEKGLKSALTFALYGIAGAFAGWLMNAEGVRAFLLQAGTPEVLLGVLLAIARGAGTAIINMDKNYQPAEPEAVEK